MAEVENQCEGIESHERIAEELLADVVYCQHRKYIIPAGMLSILVGVGGSNRERLRCEPKTARGLYL
jgi:hypothetical protein